MNLRILAPLLLTFSAPVTELLGNPVATITATAEVEVEVEVEFFEKRVRPLLIEHCLDCHSHDKKIKGGLSLDSSHDWAAGGDSGPAIVPGAPDKSLLMQAVTWQNLELQMPPKKKLSDADQQILQTWIQNGAVDPRQQTASPAAASTARQAKMNLDEARRFWSYSPLQKPQIPSIKNPSWPQSPIDHFVLARLKQQNLQPAADATPEILVRRLSYTLTGLPPKPEQIQRFLQAAAKDRQAAIRSFTDELLATPQFGETWARHWLDLARFAESSGGGRTLLFKDAWRYRDYVIESFNADRPLHQMIREQIAGDLLPYHGNEERSRNLTATGFLALGPTIYEEQDKQRLRFDIIDEQLDTIGKAFLGQTISCARCHDHKFDPISQQDYYALAGIFASTRTLSSYTANVASWITAPLPLPAAEEQRHQEVSTLADSLAKQLKEAKTKLSALKKKTSKLVASSGKPIPLSSFRGILLDDTQAKANGHWKPSRYSSHYIGEGYLHDVGEGRGMKTLTFTPKLPKSGRYQVRLAYPPQADRATNVPVHIFHAAGDDTVHIDQSKQPDIDDRFVSLGVYQFDQEGPSYVIVSNEGTNGFVCADAVQFLPEEEALAAQPAASTDPDAPSLKTLQQQVEQFDAELKKLQSFQDTRPLTMSVREEDTIADTEIRIRGDVHQKAQPVPRGFLTIAAVNNSPAIPKHQSGRKELADWLTHPQHPLTARVYVNRVWAWLFGNGLVRTVDNFGTTGEVPTHPELLDYLATQFVAEGWSTKTLIRQILTTRTWQLAVGFNSADPDNRWLSHASRRRLEAEPIRDTILAISGALDPRLGGPNIQGAKGSAADSGEASSLEFNYKFADTRRSLYTPAFRNNRLELFELFDFGDINTSQGKRHASTVAPQALFFMNHPFILENADLAAQHTLSRAAAEGASDDHLLHNAFLQSLGRPPHSGEKRICLQHLYDTASESPQAKQQAWSAIYQSLFGSIDFRYLD